MERPEHRPEDAAFPEPLSVNFESIPEQLRAYDHFVVWKYERVDGDLKKPPFDPKTGKRASVGRRDTWGSFQAAQTAYETRQFAGVGIVLTAAMGIVGIDIDHCVENGQVSSKAQHIITAIDSYAEQSPSDGIHIFLEGKLPGAYRRRGTIEMYEDMRYLTLTGHRIEKTSPDVQPRHRELYQLYHRVFQQDSQKRIENTSGGVKRDPSAAYPATRSDEHVLQKALQAKNGANFRRYYFGDSSLWEGGGARHVSQSEADFTLVLLLLYWTNGDSIQVDRLFRQSGLMREKWNRPLQGSETYGERIIHDAMKKGKY